MASVPKILTPGSIYVSETLRVEWVYLGMEGEYHAFILNSIYPNEQRIMRLKSVFAFGKFDYRKPIGTNEKLLTVGLRVLEIMRSKTESRDGQDKVMLEGEAPEENGLGTVALGMRS